MHKVRSVVYYFVKFDSHSVWFWPFAEGEDYEHVNKNVTLTLGQTTTSISVPIIDDNIYEIYRESFRIQIELPEQPLFAMINLPSNPVQLTLLIQDDESWLLQGFLA